MKVERERQTRDESYNAKSQLLRFVQKTCQGMTESKSGKIPEVWGALCFATLIPHPDLELRFRNLILDDPDMPVESFLQGSLDILQSAIARAQGFHQTDNLSDTCGRKDQVGSTKSCGAADSPAHNGRSLLLYLSQEGDHMLANSDYECVSIWELLLWGGLTFMSRTHEATQALSCIDMAPEKRLRAGLKVIRDALPGKRPGHDPWNLSYIKYSSSHAMPACPTFCLGP